jgi:hypothetical protein
MFENRNYLIIPSSEVSKINFSEVLETSAETLRYSIDGTKTFFKWENSPPAFIDTLVGAEGPYTHQEILQILSGPEWSIIEQ